MPSLLPGNILTRLVAGLPVDPTVGVLDVSAPRVEIISPLPTPITIAGVSDNLAALTSAPPMVIDVLMRDGIIESPVDLALQVDVEAIRLDGFVDPITEGTLFFEAQRVGRPASTQALRQPSSAARRTTATERAESLLAKLLPILLPPARSDLGEEPLALPHPLYAFQGDGVRWLVEHEPGALLADDMGLGKTVQAIVALRRLFREGKCTRALIVAPKAVVTSWHRHCREWAPELESIVVAGSPGEREMQWRAIQHDRAHVAITNFDSVVRDIEIIRPINFDILTIDEMQNLKNPSTRRSREMARISAHRRWGLTGTPLENNIDEMASILRFLNPAALPRSSASPDAVREAAEAMMLRRRKGDVLTDLPELRTSIEYIALGPKQRAAYHQAEERGIANLRHGTYSLTNVLALITALKQICNGVPGESAKTEWLQDYVEEASVAAEKILVFSQFVETLTHLDGELRTFRPLTYTGSMSQEKRQDVVDSFQADGDPHRVLLMSLKAGGVGITLTEANHVVHFDSWWNPASMSQATARAHRIGQKRAVIETTLVAEDTVEERIQHILGDKRELFRNMVDDLSTTGIARVLTEREIFGLFGLEPPTRTDEHR